MSSMPGCAGFEGPELPVRTPEIGRMTSEKGHESLEYVCKSAHFCNLLEAGSESAHCRAPEPQLLRNEAGHARAKAAGSRQPLCPGSCPRSRALCPSLQFLPDRGCRSSACRRCRLARPAERLRRATPVGTQTTAGRGSSAAPVAAPDSHLRARSACRAHLARCMGKRMFAPRRGTGLHIAPLAPGPCEQANPAGLLCASSRR